MDSKQPVDRRDAILQAGLEILRKEGLAGFTQPKVAAKAGLRQGNLTYYFPTRSDLLIAVARVAIDTQLAAARGMAHSATSLQATAETIASVTVRHENTRVLVALNQAADQDPALQGLFNELTDGFVAGLSELLKRLTLPATRAHVDLLHAIFVGLSVIDLATGRKHGKVRSKAAVNLALELLSLNQLAVSEGKV